MRTVIALAVCISAATLAAGCGLRNLGESCPPGPVGEFICAPGHCDTGSETCVECLTDLDCFKDDPFDRPRCEPAIPRSEGGDGRPFCHHITDHPSCTLPGSDLLCKPGQCHPDAGVCVECLEDGDCPSNRPKCDPGVAPDNLPFCREKTDSE